MRGLAVGGRTPFHIQAAVGTAFLFLTSGVFLSGFAMYMGANDLLVSYISMITNICGVSVLFFSATIGRFRSLKKVTLGLTVLSRLATLLMVLIPLWVPRGAQIAVFVPLMVVAFTLQAQTTVVLNNWMVSFVPEGGSGRYIARRQTVVLAVTATLSLAGGRVLDAASGAYLGFLLLFGVALVMSALEVAVLARIPDGAAQPQRGERVRFSAMVRVPVRCKPFFQFVVYIFLFYFILSIADSFTVVYMMRYLELPYTNTTALQMIISLPQLLLLGVWGKIGDRKGHRFALTASIWFFVGETFFLALSNPQNLYGMIPVAFLFAAVGNAGFVVSVFNRRYELMPPEGRILYDNFFSAAVGLAFILGPLTGGAIKSALEGSRWVMERVPMGNIRLLYLLSAAAIAGLQVALWIQRRTKKDPCR